MIKKKWSLFFFGLGCLILCGCGKKEETAMKNNSVVTTIFPVYDWTRNVLGEVQKDIELSFLQDNGVDLHSFQPGADDLLRIAKSDLFIYVGGESDEWVEAALKQVPNPNRVEINLLEVLGASAKTEEIVEGMETDEAGEPELDEHVWLSLRNARLFVSVIAEALGKIAPDHAALFTENAEAYSLKLSELDDLYQKASEDAPFKTLLFGDRFPFRYLTDDYGLSYYAAFSGCSAESEASFETIAFLADRLNEQSLPSVLSLESSDGSIAKTILAASGRSDVKAMTLDSMQSITASDAQNGADYLKIMEGNLSVINQALGVDQ